MKTHTKKSQENKSRAVANQVGRKKGNEDQGFEFVDNRPESKNKIAIQMYSESQTTDDDDHIELGEARKIDFPDLGTASHNYALERGQPTTRAVSDAANHSEPTAVGKAFGEVTNNYTLNLLSERQPCGSCENRMRSMENLMGGSGAINVEYIVPFGNNNAPQALRDIYNPLRESGDL